MNTITPKEASQRVLAHIHEGRLAQGSWHKKQDGREFACVLYAMGNGVKIDAPEKCPSNLMPRWMAILTVSLFDHQPEADAIAWAERLANLMASERWESLRWDAVRIEFLIAVMAQALAAAEPRCKDKSYWPAILEAHADVRAALRGAGDLKAAASKAWEARSAAYAADAAAAAARAAARAADAAAYAAAYAADAAAATAAAADAASRVQQGRIILDLIEQELAR